MAETGRSRTGRRRPRVLTLGYTPELDDTEVPPQEVDHSAALEWRENEANEARQLAFDRAIKAGATPSGARVAAEALDFIPGVGEGLAARDVYQSLKRGDYLGAGIHGVAGAMGVIPGVGDVAGKALRAGARKLRSTKGLGTKEIAELRAEGNRLRFGENEDYRMQHKAPTADNYPTGEDLNNVFPDIYGSQGKQFYGTGRSDDDFALNTIRNMRGNPNKMVTVYRAVPENINNINTGDFVTPTKQYAIDHIGDDSGYKIIKKRVRANELVNDGNSIHEFGYSPRSKGLAAKSKKAFGEDAATLEEISVFPKPQRMFPENDRPVGGEYLNPATQDILTDKNMSSGTIAITPEGKPSFRVNPAEKEIVGSPDTKGATQIKTNLFKKKAGWKWTKSPKGYEDVPTLVSVENKGKHYYTLEAEFPNGVNLTRYPKAKSEPRLRPTIKGIVKLGEEVGKISVRGKEHPVYDKIINFSQGGLVKDTFQKGGTKMAEEELYDDMGAQMELSGLVSEPTDRDPVSGNEIPLGATAEGVRDDQTAAISAGEFVIPDYAVRYHGLDFYVDSLQKAKQGLGQMEGMGLVGNPDEQTIPDETPLPTMRDEGSPEPEQREFQLGGAAVNAPTQQTIPTAPLPKVPAVQPIRPVSTQPVPIAKVPTSSITAAENKGYYTEVPPGSGQYNYTPPAGVSAPARMYSRSELPANAVIRSPQTAYTKFQGPGAGLPGGYKIEPYVNEAGNIIYLTTVGGKVQGGEPPGYRKASPEDLTGTTRRETPTQTADVRDSVRKKPPGTDMGGASDAPSISFGASEGDPSKVEDFLSMAEGLKTFQFISTTLGLVVPTMTFLSHFVSKNIENNFKTKAIDYFKITDDEADKFFTIVNDTQDNITETDPLGHKFFGEQIAKKGLVKVQSSWEEELSDLEAKQQKGPEGGRYTAFGGRGLGRSPGALGGPVSAAPVSVDPVSAAPAPASGRTSAEMETGAGKFGAAPASTDDMSGMDYGGDAYGFDGFDSSSSESMDASAGGPSADEGGIDTNRNKGGLISKAKKKQKIKRGSKGLASV